MNGGEPEAVFRRWLETSDARRITAGIARSVARYFRSRNVPLAIINPGEGRPGNSDDHLQSIENELVEFLLAHRRQIAPKFALAGENKWPYLRQTFINHCRDRLRKPGNDPFRYLYKRAADVFRTDGRFHLTPVRQGGSLFSLWEVSRPVPPLPDEELGEIHFDVRLVSSLTYEQVNRGKSLTALGVSFLEQVASLYGARAVRVRISDFITWIARHVPLPATGDAPDAALRQRPGEGNLSSGAGAVEKLDPETLPDSSTRPDRLYFDAGQVRRWAASFARQLNLREKKGFLLRYQEDCGYAAIAAALNYSSPSGAKYMLKGIEGRLRYFLRDLPWLSPDGRCETHREAHALFCETLMAILNKATPTSLEVSDADSEGNQE